MKTLLALTTALALLPFSSSAEHLDVFEVKLKDGCTPARYVQIVKEFNEKWGTEYGYRARIAVPIQRASLDTVFWLGRSPSTAAFGKAWDAWRDGLTQAGSLAAKLQARFDTCSTNVTRSGYDLY